MKIWTVMSAAALLLACSGGPKPKARAKNDNPMASALAADIEAAAATGYQPKDAVVTYAVFTRGAIKDAEGRVRTALANPAITDFVQGAPVIPGVVTHDADKLPIRIEALAQGPHAEAIRGATHATFVHSAGPSGPDFARLRWAALAANALAPDGIVVDMTTRQAFDATEFSALLGSADFADQQLKITAYLEAPELLIFHTSGMSKLGLPDVEMTEVPVATAKLAYAGFQATVEEIRKRGWVQPGDKLKMARLAACKRPAVMITHECVRLVQLP